MVSRQKINVVVTGSRGFLGRNLVRVLGAIGHTVKPLPLSDRLDRPDPDTLLKCLEGSIGADAFVNCAAAKYPQRPVDHFINAQAPAVIADFLQAHSPSTRFVHVSSINVLFERLTDPYSLGKAEAERSLSGRNVKILRPGLLWSIWGGGNAERLTRLFRWPFPFWGVSTSLS